VDRLTRKELKKDKFAQEVGHTVEFLGEHRQQFVRYGGVALAVIIVVAGLLYYNKRQHEVRQRELYSASQLMNAPISVTLVPGVQTFVNEAEKNQAVLKAFSILASKYSGSDEANIAQYYLGTIALAQGRVDDATKLLSQVASSGNKDYASVAKLALADLYATQGKTSEAEKLLRPLIASPTVLVSKEQATISLARLLASSNPSEARKLLEPLRAAKGGVGRAASGVLDEMAVAK
jgi:predicted negative regulator of RcsB-dependent stress response